MKKKIRSTTTKTRIAKAAQAKITKAAPAQSVSARREEVLRAIHKIGHGAIREHELRGSFLAIATPVSAAVSSNPCPDGQTPHEITFTKEDGTIVTKTVCM